MVYLPNEIRDIILSYRPRHPVAQIIRDHYILFEHKERYTSSKEIYVKFPLSGFILWDAFHNIKNIDERNYWIKNKKFLEINKWFNDNVRYQDDYLKIWDEWEDLTNDEIANIPKVIDYNKILFKKYNKEEILKMRC